MSSFDDLKEYSRLDDLTSESDEFTDEDEAPQLMLTALPPREPGQAVRNPFSRPGQSSIILTKRPRPACAPVKRHAPSPMPSTVRDEGPPGIAPSPKMLKASHPQPSKESQAIRQPDLPRDLTPYRHLAMITSYPLPSLRTGDMPLPTALALRCASTPSDHPLPSLISWTYGGKERSGRTRTNIERLLARPIRQLSQEDRAELALVEEEESLWQRVWQGFLDGWMSSGSQREVWYRNSLFALTASADLATINSTTIALRRALTDHGVPFTRSYPHLAEEKSKAATLPIDQDTKEALQDLGQALPSEEKALRSMDDLYQSGIRIHGEEHVLALLTYLLQWKEDTMKERARSASPAIISTAPFPHATLGIPTITESRVTGGDIGEGWRIEIAGAITPAALRRVVLWSVLPASSSPHPPPRMALFLDAHPSWKWLNVASPSPPAPPAPSTSPSLPAGAWVQRLSWGPEEGYRWVSHRPG